MQPKHLIHLSPEEKLALNSEGQISRVSETNQKLDDLKQTIESHHETTKDKTVETLGFTGIIQNQHETTKTVNSLKDDINNPEGVVRKLEEIKSAGLITNKLLKDISKKESPEPEEFPTEMKVEIKGAELVTIKGQKGDKGEKGDKGDRGEKGDSITGPRGVQGLKGETGRPGKNGKDGEDGQSIVGPAGSDGQNGSPDTPEEVIAKINSALKKIDPSQIKGLEGIMRAVDEIGKNPVGFENVGGGGDISYMKDLSTLTDGSTKTFTVPYNRKAHFVVGSDFPSILFENNGFTVSGADRTTLTLTSVNAPSSGSQLGFFYSQ
jgi:hypothetical protein